MGKRTKNTHTVAKRCWRKIGYSLILSIVAVFLTLFGIEQYYRFFYPDLLARTEERAHFGMYDHHIGWVNRPHAKGRMRATSVVVNSRGLRDNEYNYTKGSDFRILVLGDSFTWGYGVEQDERFTDLLEHSLAHCEVINMGCSGYGQDQELLLLKREGIKYHPDLVIVNVHVASDIWNNVYSVAYGYNKPIFIYEHDALVVTNVPVPRLALGNRLNKWMTGRYAAWNYLKRRKTKDTTLEKAFVEYVNKRFKQHEADKLKSNVSDEVLMGYLLKRMERIAVENDAAFLVLLTPNVIAGTQTIKPDKRFDSVKNFLRAEHIPFLDLEIFFRQYFQEHPGELVTFKHDRHWSQQGHQAVAGYLGRYLSTRFNLTMLPYK